MQETTRAVPDRRWRGAPVSGADRSAGRLPAGAAEVVAAVVRGSVGEVEKLGGQGRARGPFPGTGVDHPGDRGGAKSRRRNPARSWRYTAQQHIDTPGGPDAGPSYRDDMQWYLLIAGIGLATGVGVLMLRRRPRRPLSVEEKAAVARVAMRAIRRSAPRPDRDIFHRGRGVPDRHSAAIAENAAYGDAANFDTGGDGGGGGSD